ncbi:FmdB family zinc ribbon protein [Pseudomonas sp.]|uniref:FmdB family zinc ribbon protein n=1 Tax=Pseudomonas sp. TaxID=306 RepID=UPI0039C9771F
MGIYEYQCEQCGVFEERRAVEDRNEPAHCGKCGALCLRVLNLRPTLLTHRVARSDPDKPLATALHSKGCPCC